jgi:ATP-binding cassette, subfamily C (CFTR/MRP), member 1
MCDVPGGPRARTASAGANSDAFTETTAVESTVLTSASEAAKRITITEEEKGEGAVSASVYLAHFKAMGGIPMFALVTFGVAGAQAAVICSDYWLAFWSSNTVPEGLFNDSEKGDNFYIAGLGVISAATFLMLLLRSLLMAVASTRASFVHHDGVLQSVLRAPLFFFDTTPGD